MKNPLRHAFCGSKVNRDRRDDAFARSVIAIAEQKRQFLVEEAQETLDDARCEYCERLTCLGDCPEYYESLRDEMEDHDDDR